MLNILSIKIPGISSLTQKMEGKSSKKLWSALLLGIVFALAFCPYSGVLYFGILIPMTISSSSGLFLPLFFAIATGIPVIIFAWLLAFSLNTIGNTYNKLKIFEFWFRRIIAILFIAVGIYYIFTVYI